MDITTPQVSVHNPIYSRIYLDYNATTPLDEEVQKTMLPYLTVYFGNPSSSHQFGKLTKEAIEKSRKNVASLLGCEPEEVVFTSGGTESNNWALKGAAFANEHRGKHIITSTVEHPAVTEVMKYLETKGFKITYVDVDHTGKVIVEQLKQAITPETTLITIMHANNEIGTIQPIEEISKIAKEHNILLHTDASQSVGKIPTKVNSLGVDLLTVAGHKLYAPKGIGVLYIRKGVVLEKFMHGASHENNLRAGTENILEIVGLGKACEIIEANFDKYTAHMKHMRDLLHDGLVKGLDADKVKVNSDLNNCLPNTLSISFKMVRANELLDILDPYVAVSAGAACHTMHHGETKEIVRKISHVLLAMKVPTSFAVGTIRLSTGKYTTKEEVEKAVQIICQAVKDYKLVM